MSYRNYCLAGLLTLIATSAIAATSSDAAATRIPPPAIAPSGSLYARLGGTPVVSAFVNDTIDKVAASPESNRTFDKVNLQNVKDRLIVQICALTDGGCVYTGDPIREVRAGQRIGNTEYFRLVEVLRESMRARDVPLTARNELLELLTPMKRDVAKL